MIVPAFAQKQPLFIFLDVRFPGSESLVALGVDVNLPLLLQNPQDILVADFRVGALIPLAGHIVIGKENVFCVNMFYQIFKGLRRPGGAVIAL